MTDLHVTLVTDGASDRVLLHHLRWLLEQHLRPTISIQPQWADLTRLRERPKGLVGRVRSALELYQCDLLVVHRDAEAPAPSVRYHEIEEMTHELGFPPPPLVCLVPVRMTEAWLLFDERAIRRAAGNPNGREPLPIATGNAENLPDPKGTLHDALRSASGLVRHRRKKFRLAGAVQRVPDYIDDFRPLRALSAFARFEQDLVTVIQENGWS